MPEQVTIAEAAETDTATQVDPQNPPTDERVLLIQGISGVMHSPSIVEGELSSTGKTIAVEDDHKDKTYRLDPETIFSGGLEIRRATTYQLYTPERYQQKQQANHAPGPQAGANEISETADLPAPTHRPADE